MRRLCRRQRLTFRPQLAPQHLAGGGHRQRLREFDETRIFVGGELHLDEFLDLARERIAQQQEELDGLIKERDSRVKK